MAEEKKKVTKTKTTSKTTNKQANRNKTTPKKNTNTKKTTTKRNTNVKKSTQKKQPVKEINDTKKIEKNKVEEIELDPVVEKEVEPVEIEEEIINLDKTLIIDGEDNENLKEVVNNLEKDRILTKDKVIYRSKARKQIILILLIAIIISILFATIYIIKEEVVNKQTINSNIMSKVSRNEDKEFESEIVVDNDEYEKLQMINVEEFENKVKNKENMFIIITEQTCLFCLEYEPIVEEVLQEENKTIYELDIFYLNQDEIKRFREYYAFESMPTIFYIKDGVVVSDLVGTKTKEELSNWIKNNQ
jgi:predicted bacteriocin transport accessory protein